MSDLFGRIFRSGAVVVLCAAGLSAHPKISGTWTLQAAISDFGGEPSVETGTVTIDDREHHIYISRTFNYDNAKGGFDYGFTTDGEENSTIKKGKTFRSKAKWTGNTLTVTTTQDGLTTTERFALAPDGSLMLLVERQNHHSERLYFVRQ
jgi:hypothetical protein